MTRNHIGVDLSKDVLDIHDPRRGTARLANRPGAIAAWMLRLGVDDIIVYEATSACDRPLRLALRQAGQPGVRLNPLHAWHFARSLNRAKTDRIDAALLARLGSERQLAPDAEADPAREALRALVHRRDQLKRMQTQEKNCLSASAPGLVASDIRAELANLARRIARIEAAIGAHLARHPALAAAERLLRSLPGVGAVTAMTLLAHLPELGPELGQVDRRAIASLGALAPGHTSPAPTARPSGLATFSPPGRTSPAATAAGALPRRRPAARAPGALQGGLERDAPRRLPRGLRRAAEGVREAGEGHPEAAARRLLVVANAILRTGVPFRSPQPGPA